MPTHPPAHELSVREMLPDKRPTQARWEVRWDSSVIGWVKRSQRRSVIFNEGTAVHPMTNESLTSELVRESRCCVGFGWTRSPPSNT